MKSAMEQAYEEYAKGFRADSLDQEMLDFEEILALNKRGGLHE